MNKFIIMTLVLGISAKVLGQGCPNLNNPAAIADNCQAAPLFCGNYLENYCGTNNGLTNDAFGQKSGFLRFAPCETNVKLQFSVSNCAAGGGTGLTFRLYTETCIPNPVLATVTVQENTIDTMVVNNLQVLNNYLLAVTGAQGSQCEFNIQVVEGIGTALPGPADCFCSGGDLEGPDTICSNASVSFSIGAPSCFLSFGTPVGGNGEYCPPASACPVTLDSIVVQWLIPSVMHFVGDSTGVNIVIQLDSNYFGLDTLRLDTVWANWHLLSAEPMDSLAFCECSSVNCSAGVIPLPVIIWRQRIVHACTLTCMQPTCVIDGLTYDTPGFYEYESPHCVFVEVTITKEEPEPEVPGKTICKGGTAKLEVANYDPVYTYEWSTGEFGAAINVAPTVTTSYSVTARNPADTCEYTTSVTVTVVPVDTTDIGQVGSVSCSQPCFTYKGMTYCSPGKYVIEIDSCNSHLFQVAFSKDTIQLGEVGKLTCLPDCVNFNGTEYCQPGAYSQEDSCNFRIFTIGENKAVPVCSNVFPDCFPNNTQFTLGFTIDGQAPFIVDGALLAANYFLSTPMPNGTQYAFIVEHANGCKVVLSGTYDCSQLCLTNAGKLSADTTHGCAGQAPAQVQSVEAALLAPGDTLLYVLLSPDGAVLAQNTTGEFDFDPAKMGLNKTYFAFRSVGPPDINGFPDPMHGCTDTSNFQPLVFATLPSLSITGDSSLCEGGALTLTANGASTYVWSEGTNGSVLEMSPVELNHNITYSVTGTDIYGCTGEDTMLVEVRPQQTEGCCKPLLPNAFTPNGDGANDSFVPILPDCNTLEFAEMRIYSRWGELMFKSLENMSRWDGSTPNGMPAVSDTYVFTFRYRLEGEEERTQKGEVTLLR